ncbi:acyltransferase [Clostridium sp. MT-14]|uniref:acyltransferase n=1 Tax=Clostridium sp. MT-14 TaxID=3348360 RepID=UPI0035F3B903
MKIMRRFILLIIIFAPNVFKIFIYKKVFKWEIGKNVHIGLSYVDAKKVLIKNGTQIGNLNVLKDLKYLELGKNNKIGNLNRIVGSNYKGWANTFICGDYCGITSRHILDSGGGIYINDSVVIAGAYTQIWSHEISLQDNELIPKPTHIGTNIYIGSSALLAPGVTIPSNSIIGLGTVVPSKFKCEEGSLIVGNPACVKNSKIVALSKLNNVVIN